MTQPTVQSAAADVLDFGQWARHLRGDDYARERVARFNRIQAEKTRLQSEREHLYRGDRPPVWATRWGVLPADHVLIVPNVDPQAPPCLDGEND